MATKDDLIYELNKIRKERTKLLKQENILKAQLLPYSKYRVGHTVKWKPSDDPAFYVVGVKVNIKGEFLYTLEQPMGGASMIYDNIPEHQISI